MIIGRVTQEDIDNGIKGSASSCPLALSICRKFSSPVSVGTIISIGHSGPRYNHNLRTSEFMFKFDSGQHVSPFWYILFRRT